MEKDPMNYGLITYVWVIVLAVWGGTAHNIKKIKEGDLKRFSIAEWLGDILIAGFIGVLTFFLCEFAGFEQILTAALVGVSSHQGTRGMAVIERLIANRFKMTVTISKSEKEDV